MTALYSHFLAQGVVDPLDRAMLPPAPEMFPHIAIGRKVMRQVTPGAPGAQLIEDGIPNFPQRIGTRPSGSASFRRGKHCFNCSPFGIGQVCGIWLAFHIPLLPYFLYALLVRRTYAATSCTGGTYPQQNRSRSGFSALPSCVETSAIESRYPIPCVPCGVKCRSTNFARSMSLLFTNTRTGAPQRRTRAATRLPPHGDWGSLLI